MVLDRGGSPKILADLSEPGPYSLVGDDAALYWVEQSTIMRLAK